MFSKNAFKFIFAVLLACIVKLAYFFQNENSAYNLKVKEVEKLKQEIILKRKYINELKEFEKKIDDKKQTVKKLIDTLNSLKTNLLEAEDIPKFMSSLFHEAELAGISILSLTPDKSSTTEYLLQQEFALNCTGSYMQLISFFDRLMHLPGFIMVPKFELKKIATSLKPYTELQSQLTLTTFTYLNTLVSDTLPEQKKEVAK